ncbi:hypothetical protein H9P43_001795 [Blastocladiella emersonii ATCC 22665]|nr:hypothetical protein H9P43_001795 [Blastocladiella emersonii ATCC 22665]
MASNARSSPRRRTIAGAPAKVLAMALVLVVAAMSASSMVALAAPVDSSSSSATGSAIAAPSATATASVSAPAASATALPPPVGSASPPPVATTAPPGNRNRPTPSPTGIVSAIGTPSPAPVVPRPPPAASLIVPVPRRTSVSAAPPVASASPVPLQPPAENNTERESTAPIANLRSGGALDEQSQSPPPVADTADPVAPIADAAPVPAPAPAPPSGDITAATGAPDAANSSPVAPSADAGTPRNTGAVGAEGSTSTASTASSSSPLVAIFSTLGVVGLVAGVAGVSYMRTRARRDGGAALPWGLTKNHHRGSADSGNAAAAPATAAATAPSPAQNSMRSIGPAAVAPTAGGDSGSLRRQHKLALFPTTQAVRSAPTSPTTLARGRLNDDEDEDAESTKAVPYTKPPSLPRLARTASMNYRQSHPSSSGSGSALPSALMSLAMVPEEGATSPTTAAAVASLSPTPSEVKTLARTSFASLESHAAPRLVHIDPDRDRRFVTSVYTLATSLSYRDSRRYSATDSEIAADELAANTAANAGDVDEDAAVSLAAALAELESPPASPVLSDVSGTLIGGSRNPAVAPASPIVTSPSASTDLAAFLAATQHRLALTAPGAAYARESLGAASDTPSSTFSFHAPSSLSRSTPSPTPVAAAARPRARRVAIPYVPELEDELALKRGDLVAVQQLFHDNWAVGENLTTGESGAFPIVCLE